MTDAQIDSFCAKLPEIRATEWSRQLVLYTPFVCTTDCCKSECRWRFPFLSGATLTWFGVCSCANKIARRVSAPQYGVDLQLYETHTETELKAPFTVLKID